MITVENISKSYGGVSVIDRLSFSAGDGFYLITGRSGSGKTTLLRLVAGLEKPDRGTVTPVGGAFLFQEKRLTESMSGLRNLTSFFGGKSAAEALELAEELGLSRDDMKKPAAELSGGMAQRVAIVRLVMFVRRTSPGTVLLDEPYTGLDAETAALVTSMLERELSGKTVLIASHDDPSSLPQIAGTICVESVTD